jgi:hypothetical protein
VCQDWTADDIDPDETKAYCEDCENDSVCGAEEALILGLIEVLPQGALMTGSNLEGANFKLANLEGVEGMLP